MNVIYTKTPISYYIDEFEVIHQLIDQLINVTTSLEKSIEKSIENPSKKCEYKKPKILVKKPAETKVETKEEPKKVDTKVDTKADAEVNKIRIAVSYISKNGFLTEEAYSFRSNKKCLDVSKFDKFRQSNHKSYNQAFQKLINEISNKYILQSGFKEVKEIVFEVNGHVEKYKSIKDFFNHKVFF